MTTEVRATALADIASFCRELDSDNALATRFAADPAGVLLERDIDIALPTETGEPSSLGTMLSDHDPELRVVTLQSIGSFLPRAPRSDSEEPFFPFPIVFVNAFGIANANAGANANALANANAGANANALANANANTNTNTNGTSGRLYTAHMTAAALAVRSISVFSGYADSEVAMRLGALRLSEARQLALLKRVANDGEEVAAREENGATTRMTRYMFQGETLEVESRSGADGIEILDARILTDA